MYFIFMPYKDKSKQSKANKERMSRRRMAWLLSKR